MKSMFNTSLIQSLLSFKGNPVHQNVTCNLLNITVCTVYSKARQYRESIWNTIIHQNSVISGRLLKRNQNCSRLSVWRTSSIFSTRTLNLFMPLLGTEPRWETWTHTITNCVQQFSDYTETPWCQLWVKFQLLKY